VLSHANVSVHTRLLVDAWGLVAEDRSLHGLPLHHLHGLVVALLAPLAAGGSIAMVPRFEAGRVAAALSAGDISVFMAVPTMYGKLRELNPTGIVPPRLSTSGSAALPVTLAEYWRGVTGAIPLERYGMTEIGIAVSNPLHTAGRRPGSIGLPLPSVETRIQDDGELWVRGPNVFAGYWRRPDAQPFAEDGWFRTGDVAERDPDGYLRLRGRTSQDILKSGGYKISALEIEEVLREHPAVVDAAVVGLPDEVLGEIVVAAVEARGPLDPEEVRTWARGRLAAYKCPREVVVATLPRNPMGKVVKAELRSQLTRARR
jgi:malonyl-CoA/methylmalonyl-CoA synthetase